MENLYNAQYVFYRTKKWDDFNTARVSSHFKEINLILMRKPQWLVLRVWSSRR